MVIGADTGFLLEYSKRNPRAVAYWDAAKNGEHYLMISVLSIAEYLVYHIQRATLEIAEQFVQSIQATPNMEIVPLELDIATLSARYRAGMNLATVDSLILATFITNDCDLLLTTDSDMTTSSIQNLIAVEQLV